MLAELDKAIVSYGNNNLSRYNGKVFLEFVSKLHRKENCNANWSLQIDELVVLSRSRDYGRPLLHDPLFAIRW